MKHTRWLLATCCLCGCYFVNQPRFESEVRAWIRPDMPFAQAISVLGQQGFSCTGGNPADCSRTRSGLQPYSCVERVRVGFGDPNMLVDRIEVPKIICVGL